MAMTKCGECGNEISTTAKACPKCGAVVPGRRLWPWFVGVPVGLFILMLIYGSTIPEYQTRAREAREMCEAMAPFQKEECRRTYEKAIAEGKARGAR